MAMHDVVLDALMFSCVKAGAWYELVVPRQRQDYVFGDYICYREFENGRYSSAEPLTFRITSVSTHYADLTRIPPGFFLIAFEPIPPVVNPPVQQFVPIPKDRRIPATPRPPTRWPF